MGFREQPFRQFFAVTPYGEEDDQMVLSSPLERPRIMELSTSVATGVDRMSPFEVGDRVVITGEPATHLLSRIGVVTAVKNDPPRSRFTVRLASGTESLFEADDLAIPPAILADVIFDSHICLPRFGEVVSEHRMRFICREFDIYVQLMMSEDDQSLSGQVIADEVAPGLSLVTLLLDSEPYVTTPTDDLGEFNLNQIPTRKATLEVMVPSHRIVAALM